MNASVKASFTIVSTILLLFILYPAESLGKLRCCSGKADGVITAGNASGINDGAAAVVVMSEEKAKELGVTPMATFVGGALGGVAPEIMGVGPVASTRKVMEKFCS